MKKQYFCTVFFMVLDLRLSKDWVVVRQSFFFFCVFANFFVLLQPEMKKGFETDDLREAVRVLRAGGIILYPTDTVWGIGCDATNSKAVQKIFALKRRQDSKSMLVLLDSADKLERYVDVPEAARQLLEVSDSSRPLTIIYPNAAGVAPELIAEDGSLGIRISLEPFSQALCAQLGKPLVSTSANISGEPAAAFFGQISNEIKAGVDYICRYRQSDITPRQPSSIIKIETDNRFVIIRQ